MTSYPNISRILTIRAITQTSIGGNNIRKLVFGDFVGIAINSVCLDRFATLIVRSKIILIRRFYIDAGFMCKLIRSLLYEFDLGRVSNGFSKGWIVDYEAGLFGHVLGLFDVASVHLTKFVFDYIRVLFLGRHLEN